MAVDAFWVSPYAERVKHPAPLRRLLPIAESNGHLFDLAFHSRFATNMLSVMKREGRDVQGFERMQQSFTESVEKVRAILTALMNTGFADAARYLEMSQTGMQSLMDLMSDLALVKEWDVSVSGASNGRSGQMKSSDEG